MRSKEGSISPYSVKFTGFTHTFAAPGNVQFSIFRVFYIYLVYAREYGRVNTSHLGKKLADETVASCVRRP